MKIDNNNTFDNNGHGNVFIADFSGSYSEHKEYAKKSGNKMDEMGEIWNKTKDDKPCYWSELSYHETNDL